MRPTASIAKLARTVSKGNAKIVPMAEYLNNLRDGGRKAQSPTSIFDTDPRLLSLSSLNRPRRLLDPKYMNISPKSEFYIESDKS